MSILDNIAASKILISSGLRIGSWGEISSISDSALASNSYAPNENAMELYAFSQKVALWLFTGCSILFKTDNSTFATNDEINYSGRFLKLKFGDAELKSPS